MNINKKYPSNFWIGLALVKAKDSKILGSVNAYVNVMTTATNKKEFIQKVRNALKGMNLQLKEIEDAEPLAMRVENYKIDKKILMLANNLFANEEKVEFSTFHSYD
jgi:hypothetical protein